jgi:hypothetical protein
MRDDMRITVEIESERIKQVMTATGETKKSPAIAKAVEEYLRMKEQQRFADIILDKGLPYQTTNDEIEQVEQTRTRQLRRRRSQ